MRDPCKENSAGAVFVRLGGELYDRLEDFRRRQAKIPRRSEALRSHRISCHSLQIRHDIVSSWAHFVSVARWLRAGVKTARQWQI
jgi:hypothetical protein